MALDFQIIQFVCEGRGDSIIGMTAEPERRKKQEQEHICEEYSGYSTFERG